MWTRRAPRSLNAETATAAAEELLGCVGGCRPTRSDPRVIISALGWKFESAPLNADRDGQDAMLLPSRRHQFVFVVDPQLAARERWMVVGDGPDVAEATIRFRAGHELAHTLFFDDGVPPRRTVQHSRAEEAFCDTFARALLVPQMAHPPETATELVAVASRVRASLEILAGAVADRDPDVAVIGGIVVNGVAHVRFVAGDCDMPPEATFSWKPDVSERYGLQATGLYWPSGNRELRQASVRLDAQRFVVVARLAPAVRTAA